MTLKQQLQADLIEAMKAKDEVRTSALRMLKAAVMKFEVSGERKEAGDEDILQIVGKEIKQRKDAAEQFRNGDRVEMAENEEKEMKILQAYMPAQLSEDEVKKLVQEAIAESGAQSKKEMGKVMAVLMPKVKGKADGAMVNKLVGELLGS